jgi:hypothetical protein
MVKETIDSILVYNQTGSTITKGALVYINGFSDTAKLPTIAKADGTDATKPAQLVVQYGIVNESSGEVIAQGVVNGYNTAAQSVGALAYLSVTTPGSVQYTAPSAAGHQVQPVGVVATSSTSGDIYFFPGISFETQLGSSGIPDGSVTNAKLSSTAVTEAKTVAKTFTTTSLSDTAGILPTQLGAGCLKVISGTVAYNATSPYACITIPAKSLVTDVIAICTATFDGTSPIVDLGDDSDADGFIPNSHVGLTSGNISGEDPADRGDLLRVAGAQTVTAPSLGAASQTTTAGDWTVQVDGDGHVTGQTKTASNWTNTQGTLTAGSYAVTAWARPLKKYYTSANHVKATIGTTGSPTTGSLTVKLVYVDLN